MEMFYGHNQSFDITPIISTYGYLYNWFTVDGNANNLITDLHVPTEVEFTTLETYLGGSSVAGGKLKELGLVHWDSPNVGATDEFNITALPSGLRSDSIGDFQVLGANSYWWTQTERNVDDAYNRRIDHDATVLFYSNFGTNDKKSGFAIRCMRVLTAQEQIDFADGEIVESKTDYDGNSYNVRRIGTQAWIDNNLKTTYYLSGVALTNITTPLLDWTTLTTEAYCAYDNDPSNV